MKKLFYWLPRILAILYIAFFSIFALDSLTNLSALGMHLIPSLILLLLTIVAWKRMRLGGMLFCIAGIGISLFYHSFIIAIPTFVIGFLFLL